ncbi:MAG TPA: hypothetical protein VFV67_00445 [Actinophytocola sp.]|uniref:hypothetical protein n=1 Tax=Actinophytocola sp. TaxID=1872138 RepID=UPI002DBACF98|nr:hypothetical protein [Actinophytocola sp.]HEU5469091.1 hypothetical protein [Actinophytocola sp.]
MRNRLNHPMAALRRVTQLLALAALTVGLLPVAADAAAQKTQTGSAPAATWTLVATLDPIHVEAPRSVLTFYGAYAFTPLLVNFNPKVLGTTINQSVVPQYAVPDDGPPRTYKLVYHLTTDVTTTTSYRFNDRALVTVPGGVTDVEIIETPQHTSWNSWALRNANNDHWLWYSVKIYEQTS